MAATTTYTRALLRRLYRSLEEAGGTLKSAIETLQDARIDATSSGNQIVSTSANGHSVTFAAPTGSFSQEDLVETTERLLTLLSLVATSESLDATDEGNNEDLFNAMLLRLPMGGAKSCTSQFTTYTP